MHGFIFLSFNFLSSGSTALEIIPGAPLCCMQIFQNGMSCIIPSSESQPLSQIPVVISSPPLRSWRLTREGLVELSANSPMGAFLDKPRTAKTNTSGEGNHIRYALGSMQGWRVDMEDAHVVEYAMADRFPYKEWSFFAVFDGHAGKIAAEGAAANIAKVLMETKSFGQMTEKLQATNGELTNDCLDLLKEGIIDGFLKLDEQIRQRLDEDHDRSGSTAVCAIVTPSHIIIANLGDSRAVLSRKTSIPFGTEDHKPYHDKEKERIVGAGGSVMIQRINGSLAVSRAFGDFEYKNCPDRGPIEQLVSPEPDVYVLERNKNEDEFLLLACDGVYDVMENAALCDFVKSRLRVQNDLELVCNDVLDACLTKGSRDNMTMIIVCFDKAPQLDRELVEKEEIWKQVVRQAVLEIVDEEVVRPGFNQNDEISVEWVMRQVSQRCEQANTGFEHLKHRIIDEVLTEKKIAHD